VTRFRRWRSRHTLLLDGLLALILFLLAAGTVADQGAADGLRGPGWLAYLLVLAQAAPIVVRGRWPVWALAMSTSALFAYNALGYPAGAGLAATAVVVYTVVASRPPAISQPVLVVAISAIVSSPFLAERGVGADDFFASLAVLAVPCLAGVWAYRTRAHREQLARRASEARVDERARLARELHDIVSHAISVVVVQAEAAKRDDLPGTRQRLGTIESTARQALAEMRRLLEVLRSDDEDAVLDPQPSLAELPALVDHVRQTGLHVALQREGEARPLDPGLELSAYRIVQEALTNVVKHASARSVSVSLRYGPRELTLVVEDDGVPASIALGNGQGLPGMRERVAMLGGSLEAGPGPDGGYRVLARLPIEPRSG
jgi:signal transduction histidine kinase